jgi:RND family efflux transporter MFP subunit
MKPTYTVQRGEIVDKLQFSGRISPVLQENLFFRSEGRVGAVFVQQGDAVSEGDVLAELEGIESLERQLALDELAERRAEVQVKIAENNLEIALAELNRWAQTYQQELAIQELQLELAQIDLGEVRLRTINVQEAIADAQVVAPFTGEVLKMSLSDGKLVDAYQAVVTLADVTELEIIADVDNDDMKKLAEDMAVTIEPFSQPGETLQGTIDQLPYPYGSGNAESDNEDPSLVRDSNVHITVDISLTESGMALGDLMRVTVIIERKLDVLWLPIQAIRSFENRKFVVVEEDGVQRRVDVKLGIQSEDHVEILEGLEEGQVVIGP